MTSRKPLLAGAVLALLTIPALAATPAPSAPAWTVDQAASSVGFEGVADGSAFAGKVGTWQAQINFDPTKLDASAASVTIDMASVKTGDSSRDDPMGESAWLSPAAFPQATFTTTAISSTGPNAYVADGNLTIRGVSVPVKLPFTLSITGDRAEMAGSLTLDRTLWNIGKGSWQDKSVDPAVKVNVTISATKAG